MTEERKPDASSQPFDQEALDAASVAVHMMLLREGSSWGTKACEEIGRVFMTTYRQSLARSETGKPIQAHSKTEYKRMVAQGANVLPLDDAQVDAMLSGYKPAAHPLPTPRRFQPTTVGNMAVDKNGGYVSVDDYDLLEREADELRIQVNEWIQANGPHGWIDVLRNERSMLAKDVAELRAQLANTNRAYEVLVLDLHNLTEKVIPNIRETAERQRDEALKDAERYLDGFTVLLAYAYQMGFFTGDDSPRIRAWLEACPQRPGVTVGTAIDAAIDAAKSQEK